jgi:hypothetical protein
MREWIRARPTQPATAAAPLTQADLREAYARGRRDERARRRRSPLLAVSMAALAGAGVLAASAWQGASAGDGATVDDRIADIAIGAGPRLREAAMEARGALLRNPLARDRSRGAIGG